MSFDADSMKMFSAGAGALGAGAGALGAVTTGGANADAAQYQAAVARNNQIIAEQNAQYATKAGDSQEANLRQKTAQTIGMQRAQMAANGVDIGSGSPLRLQEDTAKIGELDALTIRNNAARAAYGYRVQGSDFGSNAALLDKQAANARTAGGIGAFSSIVGGAGSVADKWLRWRQPTSGAQFQSDASGTWNVDGGV